MNASLTLAAALLVLPAILPAAALPPDTSIAFAETPTTEWNAPEDQDGEGLAVAGGYLYSTTDQYLTHHTTGGGTGCSKRIYAPTSYGDPTYHDGAFHVPQITGSGADASTSISRFVPPSCTPQGSTSLGEGRVESITHHRGFYYAIWREGDSTDAILRQYNLDWSLIKSWLLGTYGDTIYTGPQGIAFYGDIMIMPRTSTASDDYGVEYWQFQANSDLTLIGTTPNPIWYNQAIVRYDIASEGLDVLDDLDDGYTTPTAWVIGRNAANGAGQGNSGVARFDLLVSPGAYTYDTPPVTPTGSPQVLVDQDNAEPEGIAVDDTYVYVTYPTRIEKWTHDGGFVSQRDVTPDVQDVHLGGATTHNGFLYVEATNEPLLPRNSTLLKYDPATLTPIASRATTGGSGEGGGVGVYNNKLYVLKNRDLSGDYYLQQYDPNTLDFLGESYVGYHHELHVQGLDFVNRGSTVILYAAHDVPGDPYTHPGIHLWKSQNNGADWTFHGVADYPSWTNPGDADRLEVASQDVEFGCLNDAPYVWMTGRDALDGTGFGSWTRHGVSDPDQYLACVDPPTASLTISTDTHAPDGTATTTGEWSFPLSVPGADALSTTYLKVVNSGTASGTVRVDLDDWTGPGTIPVANRLTYHYGTATTPSAVAAWAFTDADTAGSADLPAPEGTTTWIQYQVNLPSVVPDGTYAAPLTITDASRKREPGHRPNDPEHRACEAPTQGRGPPACRTSRRHHHASRKPPNAPPAQRSPRPSPAGPSAPTRLAPVSITTQRETNT